jgi:hypothetical protein
MTAGGNDAVGTAFGDVVKRSRIICYRENVDLLEATLRSQGLDPVIARATYTVDEAKFTNVYKCFLGHRNAWQMAAESDGYTLICEADFVPCAGLAALPVFWPLEKELAWGYLYQGSPRLIWMTEAGHLRGHTAPTVAYVVNAAVARLLLKFFEFEMGQYKPTDYFTFESHMQWWAMGQGAEAYIPARHYGEHGGQPNAEHRTIGRTIGRIRRGGVHRADNLQASLAFLPQYANGSRMEYARQRIVSRAYGWARLLTGRWVVDTDVYPRTYRDYLRMQLAGFRRLLLG